VVGHAFVSQAALSSPHFHEKWLEREHGQVGQYVTPSFGRLPAPGAPF